ncbi:hypothetical protein J6590_001357 [Homalodisca vitripennis]|nr:hypothetical protein J6590_001357 [Homalodisca vitripennis]
MDAKMWLVLLVQEYQNRQKLDPADQYSSSSSSCRSPPASPLIFSNALHVAVDHGSVEVARLLLKYGLEPDQGGRLPSEPPASPRRPSGPQPPSRPCSPRAPEPQPSPSPPPPPPPQPPPPPIEEFKRIVFEKSQGSVKVNGFKNYRFEDESEQLGVKLLKKGFKLSNIKKTVLEPLPLNLHISAEKKKDVEKLLKLLYGKDWQNEPENAFKWYKTILYDLKDGNDEEEEEDCGLAPRLTVKLPLSSAHRYVGVAALQIPETF